MQKNTDPTENITRQLADAMRSNHEPTLQKLYTDNYYKIEKYILNNNGTEEETKDIYQEAFIIVWRNVQLDKFTPGNESEVAGYLFNVAKFKWIDHLRSNHFKKIVHIEYEEGPLEIIEETINAADSNKLLMVRNKYKQLGSTCKRVLTDFYFHEKSLKAIAAHFNWTEATARNNKYRCLQQLRTLLKT